MKGFYLAHLGSQPGIDDSTLETLDTLTGPAAQGSQFFQGMYFGAISVGLIASPIPGDEVFFATKAASHFLTAMAMNTANIQIQKQISKRTSANIFSTGGFGVIEHEPIIF